MAKAIARSLVRLDSRIVVIGGERVMLDRDLAEGYGGPPVDVLGTSRSGWPPESGSALPAALSN